jgi:hypothetical protein
MSDLVYTGAIRSPEEYAAARERLKRLRASADMETVADIVALQGEIAKYECALLVLSSEPGFSDEHEVGGIGS